MTENPLAPPDAPGVWRPRVTVATIVQRGDAFLLVEEEVRGERVINQPAGHLEAGESLQDAAVRETLEETGWEVRPICLVRVHQWRARNGREFLRFTFGAEALRHDPQRPLDAGIVRALWLTRDDVLRQASRLRSPMVLAGIDDWLAGRRLPLDAVARLEPSP